MFSNGYIFRFAIIMVVIVGALLSTAAMLLKPFQDANIRNEKMEDILKAANFEIGDKETESVYNELIKEEWVINAEGEILSVYKGGAFEKGEVRAFDIDLKKELHKKNNGEDAQFPLFIYRDKEDTLYIIPLRGKGLWGPIWGNMALMPDWNTVAGVSFDHKSETPGLGAEISDPEIFQKQFYEEGKPKRLFNEKGDFVSITVVKGGVENNALIENMHGVDAISGGTITSDGVTEMMRDNLENYVPFIKKQQK